MSLGFLALVTLKPSTRSEASMPEPMRKLFSARRSRLKLDGPVNGDPVAVVSSSGLEVLTNDAGMTRSNSQQGDRRTVRIATALLPVPKSVNAYAHGLSELCLGQSDKSSKRRDIFAGFELSQHESLAQACRDRSGELFGSQFRNVGHGVSSR